MYIVPLAWLYVALMMAVAEATSINGTVLGALLTFVFYGAGPVVLVVYLMGAPARRRAIKSKDAKELAQRSDKVQSSEPDTSGHATADAIAPVRKKP